MRRKLAIVLAALVAVPLVALIGLGTKVVRDEQALRTDRMDELLQARLDDLDGLTVRVLEDRRQELRGALGAVSGDASAIRHLPRKLPFVEQTFIRDAEGAFVYPDPRQPITDAERDFRLNALRLHDERAAFDPAYVAALAAKGYQATGLESTARAGTSIRASQRPFSSQSADVPR